MDLYKENKMEIGILVLFVVALAGLNIMFARPSAPDIIKTEKYYDNVYHIWTDLSSDVVEGINGVYRARIGEGYLEVIIDKRYYANDVLQKIKKLAILESKTRTRFK